VEVCGTTIWTVCIVANSEEGKWDMVAIDSAVDVVLWVAKLTGDLRIEVRGMDIICILGIKWGKRK